MKKIGLFFGTFDPIHNGHIKVAQNFLINNKQVSEVWFVVTPNSPFKQHNKISSKEARLEMVKVATDSFNNLVPSDFEFRFSSPQYTSNTLRVLKQEYKSKYDFIIIMGIDNYNSLLMDGWKDSLFILNNFQIAVHKRYLNQHSALSSLDSLMPSKTSIVKSSSNLIEIDSDLIPVSSTEIRKLINLTWEKSGFMDLDGEDVLGFVKTENSLEALLKHLDQGVLTFILKNNLYRRIK